MSRFGPYIEVRDVGGAAKCCRRIDQPAPPTRPEFHHHESRSRFCDSLEHGKPMEVLLVGHEESPAFPADWIPTDPEHSACANAEEVDLVVVVMVHAHWLEAPKIGWTLSHSIAPLRSSTS
jgi:hypothetical protein